MIPERNANVVSSNMVGETVQMGIDAAATAHVMSLLTNAYADPELAIIREPATNALDSHVAAGTVGPIEVETPAPLRPTLVIRDFGLGLDAHNIRDLYSQYGASTKRQTNNATGMLGIGCKAPLAYTDQFTVTAVKGGHRIVVAIGRDEEGGGTMTVLDQHATDAPNGVEVAIPAKAHNTLAEKAAEFFSYWEPGTVLLDGVEPAPAEGWRASERFLVEPRERLRGYSPASERLRVLMGNIAYPAPEGYANDILQTLAPGYRLVAKVPIGTVSFAPSREALFDTPATRRAIDTLLEEIDIARAERIDRELSTAASAAEAYVRASAIRETYKGVKIRWRGENVPERISAKVRINKINPYNTGRTHTTDVESLPVATAEGAIWVLDFPGRRWSATQRTKLLSYLKAHGKNAPGTIDGVVIAITDGTEIPDERWLTTKPIQVRWEDVKSWRDPLDNAIGEHIGRLLEAGDDRGWRALVAFLEKVMSNPSEHSRTQLYDWLRGRPFSITEEGDLVGYKGVESDSEGGYQSLHAGPAYRNGEWLEPGKVPNAVGDVIELPRSAVTADSFVGCASGLHVGTYAYAEGYSRDGAMLKVLVNPRDVVSVPTDANAQKVRVCRYKVEAIIEAPETDPVVFTDVPEDEPEAYYPDAFNANIKYVVTGTIRLPVAGEHYLLDGAAYKCHFDHTGTPKPILRAVEDDE